MELVDGKADKYRVKGSSFMKYLEKDIVALEGTAKTAEEAIRKAGELLLAQGYVTERYVEAMVRSYKENGAYIVIAPQIALPHARPQDGVIEPSVSLYRLKEPVKFGSKNNDPVKLVFGLGASNNDEHLELLKRLMGLLGSKKDFDTLIHAKSYKQIEEIIQEKE